MEARGRTSLWPTVAVVAAVATLIGLPLWSEGFGFNPLWGPFQALRRFGWAVLLALGIRWAWRGRSDRRVAAGSHP